eukprot:412095-Rhodomonas_salina.1
MRHCQAQRDSATRTPLRVPPAEILHDTAATVAFNGAASFGTTVTATVPLRQHAGPDPCTLRCDTVFEDYAHRGQ